MDFAADRSDETDMIADVFHATFTASEGPDEGALIGGLVRHLLVETPVDDLRVFTARTDDTLCGAILFTRLRFEADPRRVMLLSPVAVAPSWQGKGVGRGLIRHAIGDLRGEGVEIVVTYGDPAFYGRLGFIPVSERVLPAPYPLQHPEGWQAQSLDGKRLTPVSGPARPVPAFADPALW